MTVIINGTTGITTPGSTINTTAGQTFSDSSNQTTAATGFGFKNRIINGAMVIDQRNAGASVTVPASTQTFAVDRFPAYASQASKLSIQQNAGSVTPPVGFSNYLGVTSLSAYTVGASEIFNIYPRIEGNNVADFGWGTANASTVTLSFWVRSSLTGSFSVCLQNSAQNRAYATLYTINSANTWEYKTITIVGDTSGTWLTNNGIGISLNFGLGNGSTYTTSTTNSWVAGQFFGASGATSVVGTNGATFYITGVQLEKGSTATSFDYRPYGTELALCQRYYWKNFPSSTAGMFGSGFAYATNLSISYLSNPVTMRIGPTSLDTTGSASDYSSYSNGATANSSSVPTLNSGDPCGVTISFTATVGFIVGQGTINRARTTSAYLGFSAEL